MTEASSTLPESTMPGMPATMTAPHPAVAAGTRQAHQTGMRRQPRKQWALRRAPLQVGRPQQQVVEVAP